MAAEVGLDKKRRVFLCYSYLAKSEAGINEEKSVPSAHTPCSVYDFVSLLVENGVPRNSILTADEPLSAGGATDWHFWYKQSIKESLATLCFITPQFSEAVQRGIDECRQIPSANQLQGSVTGTAAATSCAGGGELAGLTSIPQHTPLEPANMPHLPGHIVRRLLEDPQLTFIPIFLGQNRDVSLIPLVLQGRRNYAVQYPFVSPRIEGSSDLELEDLVQDVFQALLGLGDMINNSESPVTGIGISATSGNLFRDSRSFLSFGSKREVILKHLSSRLRLPWDELAVSLGVSRSDLEAIQYNYPMDAREQAYQMLLKWTDDHATIATVARFAAVVSKPAKVNQHLLLDVLTDELRQHQL